MNKTSSILIIGGGIVGCAIAMELANKGYTHITVLERNGTFPGLNQSSTNEGSIHSGIYYLNDVMPLKARLCVEGNALLYAFLQQHALPYEKMGKLIIATTAQEEAYLDFFLKIGIENGVPGVKKISGKDAKRMEPNLENVITALHVPSTGSAPPEAFISKVKALAEEKGVVFRLKSKVVGIVAAKNQITVTAETPGGEKTYTTDLLINSAGLYSDEIAKLINPESPYVIEPVRGEFFQFDMSKRNDIGMRGMHVYQPPYCYTVTDGNMQQVNVPITELRERLKSGEVTITAGVHLSPAYDRIGKTYVLDRVTISPLKTTGLGKEDYTSHLHPAKDYIEKVHYFFPHLLEADVQPDHTGIMAPLRGFRDFVIERDKHFPNCIQLIGMESPAWTGSLAIAKYVGGMIA